MRLYLVQHGEAKSEDIDSERSLTEKGIKNTEIMARFLYKNQIEIFKIYHSGKKRAYQTANIFSEILNVPSEKGEGLNPLDDINLWVEKVKNEENDIMIVSHLPFLEKLCSKILCMNEELKIVKFTYSGVICLERMDNKNFSVIWILTPDIIFENFK